MSTWQCQRYIISPRQKEFRVRVGRFSVRKARRRNQLALRPSSHPSSHFLLLEPTGPSESPLVSGGCVLTTQGPSWGYSKVIFERFVRKRGRFSPNVDKNEGMAPRTRTGYYPHKGPFVDLRTLRLMRSYALPLLLSPLQGYLAHKKTPTPLGPP